jgi:radical SAM superfamily enzyme YgiQ (UPF0313 family)
MPGTAAPAPFTILLVSANRCTTPEPVFPLGLAHLDAALGKAGHHVRWWDLLTEGNPLQQLPADFKPDLVGISLRNIDDVIIRKQETFVQDVRELVTGFHQKLGCPVVLGGSGFSILPCEALDLTGADYGIVGEGEAPLLSLVEGLAKGEACSEIPGLVFRQAGRISVNAARSFSREEAVVPAFIPTQLAARYLESGGILNVQTQRGCAHRCCYCTYPIIEGTRHRRRPAEAVVSEFEQLERLGASYAFVVDSVFNSSEMHVTEVCEALIHRGLKIRWGCFLRPQGLTAEMMRLMARAGLAHIEFGSDSFCDEVLTAYEKDLTFEDIYRSTELARGEDFDFCHFVIAGGPGETIETLEHGFRNSLRLGGAIIMAVPGMRIYPHTRLFKRAVAEGQISSGANLLNPAYYLAPGLTLELVLESLKRFAVLSPNWVVGDFDPEYENLVKRLRQRGVNGPLWSYFATAQRLWPRTPKASQDLNHPNPSIGLNAEPRPDTPIG